MTVGSSPSAKGEPLELHRGERVGKYELLAQLTVGGMSEVFIAFTSGPGGFLKHVVLKRILPEVRSQEHFVQMFMDEARITAGLNHANIGQVFDLGEDDEGSLFLSMEFIPGQNLNQLYRAALKRGMRGLPVGLSCAVIRDVCRALHYAHTFTDATGQASPVIHRDVAQKNIMLTYDGVTKLVDFGIAKASSSMGRTQVGTVKGTTGYMSPEQVRGDELDGRSDVFCVGIVLYELLTGKRLFAAATEYEEMLACLQSPIVPPQELVPSLVSRELNDVVMKALERDRDKRFASARDMARALEVAVGTTMYDAEQTSGLMKQLFADKMAATRALLDSAGSPDASTEVRRALRLMREDSNSDFPSGGLANVPLTPAPGVVADDEPTGFEIAPVPEEVARSSPPRSKDGGPARKPSGSQDAAARARAPSGPPARRTDPGRAAPPRHPESDGSRAPAVERRVDIESSRAPAVERRATPQRPPEPPPRRESRPVATVEADEEATRTGPPVRAALDPELEEPDMSALGAPRILGHSFSTPMLMAIVLGGALVLALILALLLGGSDAPKQETQRLPTFQGRNSLPE